MKITGILGAVIGGIAGALVWGAIAKFLQMEVGYVAWGVGLAVGFLSYSFRGRGIPNGVLCAVVALFSIYAGKVLAQKWTVTPDAMMQAMGSNDEMTSLSEAEKQKVAESAAASYSWSDAAQDAQSDLDIIDIIFALLGIGTAFKIGGSPKEGEVISSGGPAAPPPGAEPATPTAPLGAEPPPAVVPTIPPMPEDPNEPKH